MKSIRFFLSGFILILLCGCSSVPLRNDQGTPSLKPEIADSHIQETTQDITSTSPQKEKPSEEGIQKSSAFPERQKQQSLSTLPAEDREAFMTTFLEGALLEAKNRFEEAGKAYAKALDIVPDSPYLNAMTGRALLQSGRFDEAIQVAKHAIESGTTAQEARQVLALAYRQKKEWDNAIEQYEKLVELNPRSLEYLNELVSLYIRTQRFEKAIALYRKMEHIDHRRSFMYRFRIALILTQMGKYQEAIQEYLAVAKQIPNNFDVPFRLGKLYEVTQKPDEAIDAYLTALQLIRNDRDELSIRAALAPLYYQRRSYREAIHQYSRIKDLAPDDLPSRFRLASILYEQKNYPRALEETDELVKLAPGTFFFALLRRNTLDKMQRGAEGYQSFLHEFSVAIENDRWEETQRFLVDLSQNPSLERIQQYAQYNYLKSLFQKCIEQFSDQSRPLFAYAQTTILAKDTNSQEVLLHDILARLEEAITKNNAQKIQQIASEFRSWYRVRMAYKTHMLSDPLIQLLLPKLQTPPLNTDLSQLLALLYMDHSQWTESEQWLVRTKNTLTRQDPGYKNVLFQLAMIYEKMSRLADVERTMNEAMELYPDDSEVYNFLGYTYADHNIRLDEAQKLLEKALELSPDNGNILDSMGWLYFRLGRLSEAIDTLEKAFEKEKHHPVILDHLGEAHHKNGNGEMAIRYWKQALEFGPEFPYDFTPEFKEKVKRKIQNAERKSLP